MGELSACPFDGLTRERFDRLIRHRNKEPTTFLELDRKRCRLNFNQSLPPANLQLRAWLEPCFSPQFLRNHQTTGSINGCFHGIKYTIFAPFCNDDLRITSEAPRGKLRGISKFNRCKADNQLRS